MNITTEQGDMMTIERADTDEEEEAEPDTMEGNVFIKKKNCPSNTWALLNGIVRLHLNSARSEKTNFLIWFCR